MVTIEPTLLNSDLLDRAWLRWVEDRMTTESKLRVLILKMFFYKVPYSGVNRTSNIPREFERWLFDQGATVKELNECRYLEFVNAATAIMFTMRWL